jgi:hypothetical protein
MDIGMWKLVMESGEWKIVMEISPASRQGLKNGNNY